ncbi:MAG: cysteine synthase family protein [Acidobacteria bacterium]|nr:MAG: cysteine synthase family protein [Acidobacteriota bacterium]
MGTRSNLLPEVTQYSLLERIGKTPLVRIQRLPGSTSVEIFAKLEGFNPGGSVKMRPAYSMVRAGIESGQLRPGQTIIDATSGNTGIAYALIGATLGYRVLLAMPGNASPERKKILTSYGAELLLTDPLEGPDGAIRAIRELHGRSPEKFFYPDQYNNDANWKAHYETTGVEILEQTGGELTHFVAGLGTTGTFVGTSRRLKAHDPAIKTICFLPDSPLHGIEGLKHIPTSIVPGIFDARLASEQLEVSTEEAQEMSRRLAREEGLFVGVSSGAAMAAALQIASRTRTGRIVTVFPDGGDRYLSDGFWNGDTNGPRPGAPTEPQA